MKKQHCNFCPRMCHIDRRTSPATFKKLYTTFVDRLPASHVRVECGKTYRHANDPTHSLSFEITPTKDSRIQYVESNSSMSFHSSSSYAHTRKSDRTAAAAAAVVSKQRSFCDVTIQRVGFLIKLTVYLCADVHARAQTHTHTHSYMQH